VIPVSPSLLRSALILGLLSAVGPFAIDMYLPAMPTIASDLGASDAAVQGTITAFFFSFGIAQLIWGPLADQIGRRLPLALGVTLFLAASLGCWLAPDIGWLTAFRVVQGFGASVVMVLPRAIIRDLHTGTDATRLMAMVMLVISVSPMLAPLAGSGLIAVWGWRSIFLVLALAALASLAMIALMLPETLRPQDRQPVSLRAMGQGAARLLTDGPFLGLTFIGALGMSSFFIFIAAAPFVYTQTFGLSPTGFSVAFALNAIGFFAASQAAAPLGERFGPRRVVYGGVVVFLAFALLLVAIAAAGLAGLVATVACLVLANAGLGVVIPTTMVMALDDHGDVAGLASSIGGTLQMLTGGLLTVLAAPFFDRTPLPMAVAIALCAVAAFAVAWLTLARKPRPA
jgi:DHA1 family bicyclomycin/chloramphenicol resistance-like MFS transporter